MHKEAVERDPWPRRSTAAIRLSEIGEGGPWEVARRITRRIDDVWRFVERVVLIKDDLSLRTPIRILSSF